MTIAIAQPARTGNPGIVPPWLQGPRPIQPNPAPGAPATPAPQPEVPTAATRDALVAVPLSNGQVVILDVPEGMIPGGHDHAHEAPTSRRGFGARDGARAGVDVQREQQRIDDAVEQIQAAYAKLGIKDSEGNDPVKAYFRPDFPNAAYAPDGYRDYDLPADSIGVGIDPRSGHSFAEAPDVVAHELAHRIIDHMTTGKLSMHPMSEDVAIPESLADTFAALVDRDDWTMGEQLVEPVRIMDHPERLGHPGHVKDLKAILRPGGEHMVPVGRDRNTGEVIEAPDWHVVAGIPNKAATIIGDELGRDKLGEIYIKAVREGVRPGGRRPRRRRAAVGQGPVRRRQPRVPGHPGRVGRRRRARPAQGARRYCRTLTGRASGAPVRIRAMDDVARVTAREDSDLASIVLGATKSVDDRRLDAPERVPAWLDDAPARGYDARSVAVLALVVGVLAAIIGWSTTIGDSPVPTARDASRSTPAASPDDALGDAFGAAGSVVERSARSATTAKAASAAVTGANLAAGRIVATRSGSGAGLVALSVRNTGDAATAAGTDVLVLADGDVMGTAQLGVVAPGASARVEVPLDWCPSGTVALVAVIDPGSVVREASEFDNSVSRSASFGC